MSKKDELKDEFRVQSGIDLTDFEIKGKFPKFDKDKQKWGVVERGTAWKMYAEFLQAKLSESAHTAELVSDDELRQRMFMSDMTPAEFVNQRHAQRCKEVAKAAWLRATGRYTDFDSMAEEEFEVWYNQIHEK